MLEDFFGSKAKVRIMREMASNPDRDYSVEDIARAVGMSYGTVHPAVAELAQARALVSRKAGRSRLYMINRKHPLFREVQTLVGREMNVHMDIAEKFVSLLDKTHVEGIVLFGSLARKNPNPGDIDILIVTGKVKEPGNLPELTDIILDEYDTVISPICLSKKALANKLKNNDSFVVNVMNEGVLMWGEAEWLGKLGRLSQRNI